MGGRRTGAVGAKEITYSERWGVTVAEARGGMEAQDQLTGDPHLIRL